MYTSKQVRQVWTFADASRPSVAPAQNCTPESGTSAAGCQNRGARDTLTFRADSPSWTHADRRRQEPVLQIAPSDLRVLLPPSTLDSRWLIFPLASNCATGRAGLGVVGTATCQRASAGAVHPAGATADPVAAPASAPQLQFGCPASLTAASLPASTLPWPCCLRPCCHHPNHRRRGCQARSRCCALAVAAQARFRPATYASSTSIKSAPATLRDGTKLG